MSTAGLIHGKQIGANISHMSKTETKRASRELNKADWDAVANLKALFRKSAFSTQVDLGAAYGANQSAMSQYLNGKVKLGHVATLRFAKVLGVQPTDIREDFDLLPINDDELSADAKRIAAKWMSLNAHTRRDFEELLDTIPEDSYGLFLFNARKEQKDRPDPERKAAKKRGGDKPTEA